MPSILDAPIAWSLLLLVFAAAMMRRSRRRGPGPDDGGSKSKLESYAALDHVFLNVKAPESEWLNMGWWIDGDAVQFPDAAATLARKVIESIPPLPPNARILDVGHGCGDSLLLIHELLKPGALHGVTSLPSHAARASARTQGRASVACADAVAWLEQTELTFDAIVAIDCAYHFSSRLAFFQACAKRLSPGGSVVLLDMVGAWPQPPQDASTAHGADSDGPAHAYIRSNLPDPSRAPSLIRTLKHRVTCMLAATPARNFCSVTDYQAALQQAGFAHSHITDVSHAVFPGFAKFLQGLGKGAERAWRGGSTGQLMGLRSFGEVVEQWAQGGDEGMVRAVFVQASVPR